MENKSGAAMQKRKRYRLGIALIGLGVIVGLVLAAGVDLTSHTRADAQQSVTEKSAPESQVKSGDIQSLKTLSNAFANVAEKVNRSVVTITTETVVTRQGHPFMDDEFFRKFFDMPDQPEREQKRVGLGSGVIVSGDGIILTNNHVVENADNIKVKLMDGSEYVAEVKGTDAGTDLAILKIDKDDLPAIKFGDSDMARVGEWVLAIGSPLSDNLAHSVTSGIISAKGRSGIFDPRRNLYEDFIQTDAAINPGNSGGALVNLDGELIGINTAIASRTGGFMGIGFAIPSGLVKKVMNDILEKGHVVRGWLGVLIQDVTPQLADAWDMDKPVGVVVSQVVEDSPAEKAGLKTEDIILALDGQSIKNSSELRTTVASRNPGDNVEVTVLRDGDKKDITVELGELPDDQQAAVTARESKADLGIKVSDITGDLQRRLKLQTDKGVVITRVSRRSAAQEAGLRPGDIILQMNRQSVEDVDDYNRYVKDIKAGDTILLYIRRDNSKLFVAFTLPEDE